MGNGPARYAVVLALALALPACAAIRPSSSPPPGRITTSGDRFLLDRERGGGYDHEKNIVIGRSPAVDVLLFDTDGPEPDSGELYDRFVANGVTGKPIVNVELFGGWTGRFEHGLFPDSLKRVYFDEIAAAATRPGLSVFFHNNHWLQSQERPLRYDLAGDGTPGRPGIRWYFERVREARTSPGP